MIVTDLATRTYDQGRRLDLIADWTGFRRGSAPPIEAGEAILGCWRDHGRDPRDKLLILSDAMDVDSIERVSRHFARRRS